MLSSKEWKKYEVGTSHFALAVFLAKQGGEVVLPTAGGAVAPLVSGDGGLDALDVHAAAGPGSLVAGGASSTTAHGWKGLERGLEGSGRSWKGGFSPTKKVLLLWSGGRAAVSNNGFI